MNYQRNLYGLSEPERPSPFRKQPFRERSVRGPLAAHWRAHFEKKWLAIHRMGWVVPDGNWDFPSRKTKRNAFPDRLHPDNGGGRDSSNVERVPSLIPADLPLSCVQECRLPCPQALPGSLSGF